MVLRLDFTSGVPIYQQIRNEIVLGIASGNLAPGEKLPTIRALADESGVNMMTVNKAYALLKQEGYILADRRSGAVVNPERQPAQLPQAVQQSLKLFIAELKLAGYSKEELLTLCSQFYEEKEDSQ